MTRRTFLLGATATIAAGCGGGGSATRLTYRRVPLDYGYPLGLDDRGNIYMEWLNGSTMRLSDHTYTVLPVDSPGKKIQRVRPDGTLVAAEGYFTPDGTFHPLRLPTFEELGIVGPSITPDKIQLVDANTRGEFVGIASYNDSSSLEPGFVGFPRTRVFVMRQTGAFVLPPLYDSVGHLQENGYFIAGDPALRGDSHVDTPSSARLFGPDNTLASHPLNTTHVALKVLREDLSFVGVGIANGDSTPDPIVSGNSFALVPDSRTIKGALSEVLVAPTGELFERERVLPDSSLEASWHLVLPDNTRISLTELVPSYLNNITAVAINARREILLSGGSQLFLLTPLS